MNCFLLERSVMEKQYNRDVQIIHDFDGVSIDIMNSNE